MGVGELLLLLLLCLLNLSNSITKSDITCIYYTKIIIIIIDEAHEFISEIGRRASLSTADPRETIFLYQRISTAIQRFNAVCLSNTFTISESPL